MASIKDNQMRVIEFLKAGPSASEQDIALLENAVRISLPEEFKSWLMVQNGGWPDWSNNFIPRDVIGNIETSILVSSFFNTREIIDVRRNYENRLLANILPFADDGGGNLLCIGISGEQYPCIYFWDHEQEPEAFKLLGLKLRGNKTNLHLVAKSFSEFLEMLETSE